MVVDPRGATWRVSMLRGNVWPGWSWTYRVSLSSGRATPTIENPVLEGPLFALPALNGPPALWRWLMYRLRRREDHRVVVRRAEQASIRGARLDVSFSTKAEAAAAAASIAAGLERDGTC
ncbi:hypothetical protein [Aquipuribacter sp. SD81]|uniref:hypothetical protein n=1 Tax=Aquipuribacter sp. SD81 TaxID=3127703 RepID=UPI003018C40C